MFFAKKIEIEVLLMVLLLYLVLCNVFTAYIEEVIHLIDFLSDFRGICEQTIE